MDWWDDAYRRYADQLYTYAVSLTGDRDGAVDVVHDTFVVAAQRITQLRDPDRLRPWLYAITRSVGLRQLRRRQRYAPLAVDPAADTVDFVGGVHSADLASLVREAMAGLSEKDSELIELALRHGM